MIDTVHLASIDTVHCDTFLSGTVHPNSVRTLFIRTVFGHCSSEQCSDTVHPNSVRTLFIRTVFGHCSSEQCSDTVHPNSVRTLFIRTVFGHLNIAYNKLHPDNDSPVDESLHREVHAVGKGPKTRPCVRTLFIRTVFGHCSSEQCSDTVHPNSVRTLFIRTVFGHCSSEQCSDTVHPNSVRTLFIRTVFGHCSSEQCSDTVHPNSVRTLFIRTVFGHCSSEQCSDTVHPNTVHPNTVHPEKNETICGETEKIEVLILKVDENGMLRDEEGQDPFQGLPHQDPRNHIEELEDLVSRSDQNEVWDDIERAFLYKFLDDAEATREKEKNDKWDKFLASLDEEYMIPIQLLDDIIAKRDEQHGFVEPSRAAKAETSDPTSTSIDTTPATSIDTNTSMLIGTTKTIDTSTATPIYRTTSSLTNVTTSTSIDGMTSESIAHTIPSSIDGDSCFRTRPLEIPESSSCPQDITDSTQKSIDISSCDPTSDGDREITMEDFLELEEFLELEDGEKL
ncbi:hypothetical protein F2Q69_00013800 [Brassica cretica]|uniref:Uncharacterized protein n=1 Tax=Brassica cretica TaxID=69181 RepID=A0A8S9QI54_BRACR|nr:hypothetical protein F2Q69_00013800 [Brassica cretica]